MKFIYPAVITKKDDGMYRAEFPDLEDCFAEAETLEDVIERAKEAETDWISLELSENLMPPPRTELSELSHEEGVILRNLSATIRFFEGWEE